MTEKTNNDIYILLEEIKNQQNFLILDEDEIKVLKEVIKDRQALGRVWSMGKYVVGGIATIIVSWQIITGEFFKWIVQGLGKATGN